MPGDASRDQRAQDAQTLTDEADRVWQRTGPGASSYRQLLILPVQPLQIPGSAFSQLFPEAAIPTSQHAHGFPLVDSMVEGAGPIYHLGEDGWRGVIPQDTDRPPGFLWLLRPDCRFLYREILWEEQPLSITLGHTHVGSLLQIALAGIFFFRRLGDRLSLPADLGLWLQLDLSGMQGRGIVAYAKGAGLDEVRVDAPPARSPRPDARGLLLTTLGRLKEDPLAAGYALIVDCIRGLRPDLCDPQALEDQLRRRYVQDQWGGLRFLGFLSGRVRDLGRRGIVSLSGQRVGIIEETRSGSRFVYDESYLTRPDAQPISPTLPLRAEPYERRGLLPFFSNLLPEGEQRDLIAMGKKIPRDDLFGLLIHTSRHSAGAVEVEADVS